MTDDEFKAWLARQDKEASYAVEARKYGNPANHVTFSREKGEYMDRIKELLREWAAWMVDKQHGYPSQSPFATERVQSSNRSADTYFEMPPEIKRLNDEVERLAPGFKRIIHLEYMDRRPQKTKAALMGIPREVFSVRLRFCHEQLNFSMWGK